MKNDNRTLVVVEFMCGHEHTVETECPAVAEYEAQAAKGYYCYGCQQDFDLYADNYGQGDLD